MYRLPGSTLAWAVPVDGRKQTPQTRRATANTGGCRPQDNRGYRIDGVDYWRPLQPDLLIRRVMKSQDPLPHPQSYEVPVVMRRSLPTVVAQLIGYADQHVVGQ
jgi:hypothetical protein